MPRYGQPVPEFELNPAYTPTADQPKAIAGLAEAGRRGAIPDPAGRDRDGKDVHDGGDDRGGAAALAGDRPQQDACRAALQRVPRVLPRRTRRERKADTDANFELLTRRLLDARPKVRVAIASHNLRSVAHAIAYNRLTGGADSDLELQVLRGLGDPLQVAIASLGLRVRTYCPVGDLVAGMAYLVRRLLENTSNESFLYEQARGVPLEELLAAPV